MKALTVYVVGGRYIIGEHIDGDIIENPFIIIGLQNKITLAPVALGTKQITLNFDNVEFAFLATKEITDLYKKTIEDYAVIEAEEKAKKAGIILADKVAYLKAEQ